MNHRPIRGHGGRLGLLVMLAAAALLAGCQRPADTGWSGYAEGDFVCIAAPVAGTLTTLAVEAGQQVAVGETLFTLDPAPERAERAEVEWRRQQALVAQDFVSRSRLDDAATAHKQAQDRVAELEAALRVANLPARVDERTSAQAQAEAARQAHAQLAWREQQTVQTAPVTFFFLPSILLSGFMFPFRGMPGWAQAIGEVLPLTHFLRIVRGILLKGNGAADLLPELWPMLAFLAVAGAVALKRYRQTLD